MPVFVLLLKKCGRELLLALVFLDGSHVKKTNLNWQLPKNL
jgi:hypothetical protein